MSRPWEEPVLRDAVTPAERLTPPPRDKRASAIAYLRERGIYCLDAPVKRLAPAKREPRTVLDRWIARRSA